MATKNIAISEEAYQRLKALKRPGESFTDLIERMTRNRGILELSGVLSAAEASAVRDRIETVRAEESRRVLETARKLG